MYERYAKPYLIDSDGPVHGLHWEVIRTPTSPVWLVWRDNQLVASGSSGNLHKCRDAAVRVVEGQRALAERHQQGLAALAGWDAAESQR